MFTKSKTVDRVKNSMTLSIIMLNSCTTYSVTKVHKAGKTCFFPSIKLLILCNQLLLGISSTTSKLHVGVVCYSGAGLAACSL